MNFSVERQNTEPAWEATINSTLSLFYSAAGTLPSGEQAHRFYHMLVLYQFRQQES